MRIPAIAVGVVLLVAPGVSVAQVTQSYTYDANGRLTGVVTTNGASTNTSTYAYDDADNRTSRSQTGASTWAAVLRLPADQPLRPDQALTSPDGRYSLAVRPSGRMELWSGDGFAVASPSAEAFRLTNDGEAHFQPSVGTATAPANAWLTLTDNGDLVLSNADDATLWRSAAATGSEQGR